ncbi:MAG TPA: LLM class flavin-dependent oxidoreductase [Actinomycetota bacterium]|nr:LLM class flavin-dependent oxidoreductase [Actinomycetota bacterium]
MFGLNVDPSIGDPAARAIRAEDLGFDFVSVNDHLHGDWARYETWTMLAWMAANTSRIRVASRVLAVPYRHPAVVAKMAETLDRLSGGRLILGLGGGYSDEEFAAFGLGTHSPRDKIDGLEEAIHIARGLWSERDFTFQGRLYRTERARLEPKPDREIPIWVGTYGNRALALTGRLADGWIPTYELAPPERIPEMRERILTAAEGADRDPSDITAVYNLDVRVDGGSDAPDWVVAGSPEAITERLLGFMKLGFSAFNLAPHGPGVEEQANRLAKEVLPAVRSAV